MLYASENPIQSPEETFSLFQCVIVRNEKIIEHQIYSNSLMEIVQKFSIWTVKSISYDDPKTYSRCL